MIMTTGLRSWWTASSSTGGAWSVIWEAALTELTSRVEDRNLEEIRPAEAEAVTVEVFARWVHHTLSPAVAAAGGESLAVRVWETPVAFGGYRARC